MFVGNIRRLAFLGGLGIVSGLGCGDKITYIECPPGTQPQGSQCVPFQTPTDVVDGAAQPDASGDAPTDVSLAEFPTIAPDALDVPRAPDTAAPSDGGDAGAADDGSPVPGSSIGAHCATSADCGGETCLGWPSGYCTVLDCDTTGCPDGSACTALTGGNTACLRQCQSIVDCLTDGTQGCKSLPAVQQSAPVSVCHGVDPSAGDVGALCGGDLECADEATCLATIPGGYCAVVGCSDGDCPTGAACVKFDGVFTCMATCGVDEHCPSGPDAERRCAPLKKADGQLQSVCIAGGSGKAVGASCVGGVECASGDCEILGQGRCSQTSVPCDTEADCNGAEFCVTGPENVVGVCTAACQVGAACPGASYCVGEPGSAAGLCRPACTGLTDTASCPEDAGFQCVFGYPLGDTTGQGKYLCFRPGDLGAIGSPCASGTQCASGSCSADGVCTDACGIDYYCPFPGSCVAGPTVSGCFKACFSQADCPAQTTCSQPQGAVNKVCQ